MKMFLCKLILSNGSVNYKRPPPPPPPPQPHPGIGQVFVILFRKELKMPYGGAGRSRGRLKNRVQMPHPGTTPKFPFPVKLQIPNLWEICNNLIKLTREAPYANCS